MRYVYVQAFISGCGYRHDIVIETGKTSESYVTMSRCSVLYAPIRSAGYPTSLLLQEMSAMLLLHSTLFLVSENERPMHAQRPTETHRDPQTAIHL